MLTVAEVRHAFDRHRRQRSNEADKVRQLENMLLRISRVRAENGEEFDTLLCAMLEGARSQDEAVELASWLLTVTVTHSDQPDNEIVRRVFKRLLDYLPRWVTLESSPASFIRLVLAHDARISDAIAPSRHPLVRLYRLCCQVHGQNPHRLAFLSSGEPSVESSQADLDLRVQLRALDGGMQSLLARMADPARRRELLARYRQMQDFGEASIRWEIAKAQGRHAAEYRTVSRSHTSHTTPPRSCLIHPDRPLYLSILWRAQSSQSFAPGDLS